MNAHRLTIIAMAMALSGFVQVLVAEENISTPPANVILPQNVSEPKPQPESIPTELELRLQTFAQPADNLLSELKVYPAF